VRILTVTVVLCALAFPTGAIAAGDDGAEMKARTHYAAGEYKEALEIYARLYAETMHPTYLRNIARCHQNLGNPDKAISSFREYLRKAHDLTPDQRKEIEGYIAEMEQLKQSKAKPEPPPAAPPPAAAPPATAPPPESAPPLVGPPTVAASGTTSDDGGAFYTRGWFWGGLAVIAAAGVVAFLLLRDSGPTGGNLGALDLR
jgi:tetratricopeptide (TPR) repeat protein